MLLCVLLTLPLSSCYDAKELDEWAYVYSLGIDKGKSDTFRLTVQLPNYKSGAGGGGGGQSSSGSSSQSSNYTTISIDCPSLYTGLNMMNASMSRTLNMMHCKYILISEALAKKDVGFVFDSIIRDRQVRRVSHLIIVKGEASKFIESFNPVVGTAIAKTQEDQMIQVKLIGLSENTTVGDFLNEMKSTTGAPIATLAAINDFSTYKEASDSSSSGGGGGSNANSGKNTSNSSSAGHGFQNSGSSAQVRSFFDYTAGEVPRKGGNMTEYLGTALFDGGKMVGELDGGETQVLEIIKGQFGLASFALQDPVESQLTDTLKVRQQKVPDIKIGFNHGKPVINLSVFLQGDMQQIQSIKGKDDSVLIPQLEKEFATILKDKINETFEKCRSSKCDVFDFGGTAVKQFSTIQKWESYNWFGNFKDATLNTQIQFVITRDGTLLKNNPIINTSGAGSAGGNK